VSERLKPLLKEALREVLEEGSMRPGCCSSCELEPGEHARHHHLLREAFSLRRQVLNTLAATLAGGGLLWLGLAVWEKLARQLPR